MATPYDFSEFLGAEPDILYEARRPQTQRAGLGRNFLDFYRSRFDNVRNQYFGNIGRTMESEETPTQTFSSFLDDFDWAGRFRQLSPMQRGDRSALAPRIRYNF
jgi:hypothetical protein